MKTLKAKITLFLLGSNLLIVLMIGYFGLSLYQEEKINDLHTILDHLAGEIVEEHLNPDHSIESLDYLLSIVHVKSLVQDSYISHPRFLILKDINTLSHEPTRIYSIKKLEIGGYFVLSSDLSLIHRSIRELTVHFIVGIIIMVLIVSTIFLWYLKYLFRPLKGLVDYCESVSTQKLLPLTPFLSHADYEIERVHTAITRLLKRIDTLRNQEKEIFKEAAHELKSPLAILKARLDLYALQDDFDKKEFIAQTNKDVGSLTKIVKSLIFIKTVESELDEHRSIFDIRSDIEELSIKFSPILKQQGHRITIMTNETFFLERQKELFNKVILVVFENSVIYGEKETPILIDIHSNRREIVITNTKSITPYQGSFSSKIGMTMIKRLQSALGYTYTITEDATTFTIALSFDKKSSIPSINETL